MLLARLYKRFGFRDTVLFWLESFLTDRTACVRVKSSCSHFSNISCGVPQGSVLGPLLFQLYVAPISDIVSEYGLKHIIYADDITIYVSCNVSNFCSTLLNVQLCIAHVVDWLISNRLKINVDKTVTFLCGPKCSISNFQFDSVNICGYDLPVMPQVKLLGVIFDRSLRFDAHVASIRRKCFLQLRNLSRVKKYVNDSNFITLIHCFVFSHIDYCNALLLSCKSSSLLKLQRTIYSAARLAKRLPRHHHNMSNVVKDLGWLGIHNRILFKLCCFVHRIVYGFAPSYLMSLISPASSRTCTSHLRSHSCIRLHCPISSSVRSRAAFCFSAPRFWNSLPTSIKCIRNFSVFKRHLKAHLR